ncbi:MAG TPA: ABC transporter ATP-binding protein [Clostridia bacterium]|nr:ABC transporter ATP-binding protein [Clostridia bacterium]
MRKKFKDFFYIIKFCFNISWKASRKYVIIRVVLEVILAAVPFAVIVLGKKIINFFVELPLMQISTQNKIYKLAILLVILMLINIINRLIARLKEYYSGMHKDLISREVEIQISEQTSSLDLSYFDSVKFYNEMNNAKRDSGSLQTLTWFVMDIIRGGIQLIISFVVLAKLNAVFALMIIITGIPSIFMEKRFRELIYNWQRNHVQEERKITYILNILTGGIFAKDIRLFGIKDELISRYKSMWDTWFKGKRETTYKLTKLLVLLSSLPEIGAIGISLYVGIQIILGNLTVGDYSLYNGMIGQLLGGLFSIITLTSTIYDNNLRIINYNNFIKWGSNIKETGSKKLTLPLEICFENVSFKYPDTEQYILQNLTFSFKGDQKVALVGVNGSGKSTIVKLLLRYYDPTEGRISVNGIDIKECDLKDYRKHFSVMFQDYANYAFTIREDIVLSDLDNNCNIEKVEIALDRSGARDIANKFDTGIETYLTRQFEESGKELSGGQWQKIALARTFFRDGDIIILDEPSATLDPEAEHQVFEKFTELCKGKGAIFISHRLSNATMADRIIVLDKGKIIEDGSHKELMAIKGKYAYLFNLQMERYVV